MDRDRSASTSSRRQVLLALGALCLAPSVEAQTPDWLTNYQRALQALETPDTLQFTQHSQVTGWQTGDLNVRFQTQGGQWRADITEDDRKRTLTSTQIDPVSHRGRLAIYAAYVSRPERLAPEATFPLLPENTPVRTSGPTTWDGKPVYYAAFDNGVPIRELWLDPVHFLPVRVHWVDGGSYGSSEIFMDFQPVGERYWLPTHSLVKINLNFWVPIGFSRRVFEGPLEIATTYQDYRLDPAGELPADAPPPPAQPTTKAALTTDPPRLQDATLKPTKSPFDLSVSNSQSTSVLADRIAAFNLSKPEAVSPYTHINILLTFTWGQRRWPTYLFRFDTKQPLLPLESVTSGEQKSFPLFGGP
ncbi:hypothetical protein [Anthocerotibacter panamensis]|uniref:hypothetical protein n=1 Tax=Anthocerotibacter panamensis TaxID=2857077 RepID=UPI001C40314B|nr:hypothetical protein [Anthocerotibacter panamensis]